MVERLPNMKFKESKVTKRTVLFPHQLIMENCEKSEIGCKMNRRVKKQDITVNKVPLESCVQARRAGKPVEMPFHRNRQG